MTPHRATEYYRTRPPNSSPKFCWLNGKAPKGDKIGGTNAHFQKSSLTSIPPPRTRGCGFSPQVPNGLFQNSIHGPRWANRLCLEVMLPSCKPRKRAFALYQSLHLGSKMLTRDDINEPLLSRRRREIRAQLKHNRLASDCRVIIHQLTVERVGSDKC
jgi:hypothetical protein